jgi:anti-sigma factor RsiW
MRPSVEELTCRELVELVTEYFEGALPAPERVRFEEHVAGCEPCRSYIAQLEATIAAVGRLDAESLPPDVQDALCDAFRGWKAGNL